MARNRVKKGRPVSGWLILDKPLELGSTPAVGRIKWLFGAQTAGHAGTLDPLATGVLPGIRGLEEPFEERFWPMLSAAPRKLALRRGLVVALGLDGNACALVLGSGVAP